MHGLRNPTISNFTTASAKLGPERPSQNNAHLSHAFTKLQSSCECSNIEKHRTRNSVQHPDSRPAERLKSAEELHLEAVRELYLSYENAYRDLFTNDAKQTTYLDSKHRSSEGGKKMGESGGGASSQPDAIQSSLNASSYNLHQTELAQSQDNVLDMGTEDGKEQSQDLNQEHSIRLEIKKAAANANRNLRLCEDCVAEAREKGMLFPSFERLLVEKKWLEVLRGELRKPYMETLHQFVSQEAGGRIPIYPPPAKLFNAFNSCPFNQVKVVIIGQDPYHGPGQAMGLCFSVENGIRFPSSLLNIFKEIQNDLGCSLPTHGNLEKWAHQGVLLLNTVLTVREHHANSHAKKGWEVFTDAAIQAISQQRSGVVFLLWGKSAQEKIRLINIGNHHVLKAVHPSGISAHRGFFDCRHFSKTNKILEDQGLLPIDWQV